MQPVACLGVSLTLPDQRRIGDDAVLPCALQLPLERRAGIRCRRVRLPPRLPMSLALLGQCSICSGASVAML